MIATLAWQYLEVLCGAHEDLDSMGNIYPRTEKDSFCRLHSTVPWDPAAVECSRSPRDCPSQPLMLSHQLKKLQGISKG